MLILKQINGFFFDKYVIPHVRKSLNSYMSVLHDLDVGKSVSNSQVSPAVLLETLY